MPSTVADIFAAASASPAGVVRWGTPPAPPVDRTAPATGVYVVALTDELDSRAGALAVPPISEAAIEELLAVRLELTLDDARPTREQLLKRLAGFWFPDEVVVYIGLAGHRKNRPVQGEVAKRMAEYYATPLGANGPHAGGWPLKTLACLHEVYVHYAYCDRVNQSEKDCTINSGCSARPDPAASPTARVCYLSWFAVNPCHRECERRPPRSSDGILSEALAKTKELEAITAKRRLRGFDDKRRRLCIPEAHLGAAPTLRIGFRGLRF